MQRIFMILMLLVSTTLLAGEWEHKRESDEQKAYAFEPSGGMPEVVIESMFGSIKVTGYAGSELRLDMHKEITARSEEKLDEAERDVRVDITREGNSVVVYVDAPYRCRDGMNYRGEEYYGYRVKHDFTLRVPFETALALETFGEIDVDNVKGDFDISAVEGRVSLREISGSGRAHSVAGDVLMVFAENPKDDCSFGSVSGDVDLNFNKSLSADFRIKTLSGGIFTDFATERLAPRPVTSRREKGMFIYKGDGAAGVRVGSGGPEIEIETISGDVLIAKRQTR